MTSLYRVRTIISGGPGGDQVGTFYFDASSPNTAQDAADAVHAFWGPLLGQIVSDYTFTTDPAVETIDQTTGQPTGITAVTATPQVGTNGPNHLPPATQALIQWRTGFFLGGREIRGRTFIPGLALGTADSAGKPNSSLLTAMASAATGIITWTSSDFVVYSRKHHAHGLVSAGNPWTKFSVLRSRRQ